MSGDNKKETLSIVISAFNEEGNIKALYDELRKVIPLLKLTRVDIVFVNDASTDATLDEMKKLQVKDSAVKIVNLMHNAGHEIAMTAGMEACDTDGVVFMDADLQHPPVYIAEMVKRWKKGADIILTNRKDNEETSAVYKFMAKCFYRILNLLSDTKIQENTPDFRLLDRKYIEVLKRFNEHDRLFRGLLSYIMPNDNVEVIDFVAPKRFSGESKYNFRKSFALALSAIMQFSVKPLRISVYLGVLCAIFALSMGAYVFIEYWFLDKPTPGYATLMITMVLIGAIQLIVLGIIGEYIGKISMEVKKRPLYFAEIIEQKPIKNKAKGKKE